MTIVKPNLSSLVQSQLPEFIQEDYQTFIAFLEAYYQFLEQNYNQDYDTLLDVDTTLDSFVQYFKNELAINFPTTLVNERFLLQHIKELYASKGTEPSYRLLFRLLYGKQIDVAYPSDQVLRVSDGNWFKPVSIFINPTIGSPNSLVGNYVYIYSYVASTKSTNKIRIFVESCNLLNNGIYELGISSNYNGSFNSGDKIITSNFTGSLVSTTSKISILQAGVGFKQGQIFEINGNGSNTPSRIIVKKVDKNGGLKVVKFINYGIGYSSNFTINLRATTSATQNYFSLTGTNGSLIESNVNISDSGSLNKYDYAITSTPYVDPTYAGASITSFYDVTSSSVIDQSLYGIVSIELGPVANYQGYYKSNSGFISDNIFIQDSKYYQNFSYVIKSDVLFESYKSVFKNLIHPTGHELYGEYNINRSVDSGILSTAASLTKLTS